jgi:hypothetical protein
VDVQVTRDVGEMQILRAEELNGRTLEQRIVIFADIAGVF